MPFAIHIPALPDNPHRAGRGLVWTTADTTFCSTSSVKVCARSVLPAYATHRHAVSDYAGSPVAVRCVFPPTCQLLSPTHRARQQGVYPPGQRKRASFTAARLPRHNSLAIACHQKGPLASIWWRPPPTTRTPVIVSWDLARPPRSGPVPSLASRPHVTPWAARVFTPDGDPPLVPRAIRRAAARLGPIWLARNQAGGNPAVPEKILLVVSPAGRPGSCSFLPEPKNKDQGISSPRLATKKHTFWLSKS